MTFDPEQQRRRRLEAARGYLELDLPDRALEELDRIELVPDCSLDVHQLRGEALRQKCEYRSALRSFRRALVEDPVNVSILLAMAWCYKRIGQLKKAIRATEAAYRLAPEEPVILYNLACYFALAGRKAASLSWLGRSLRMESSLRRLIPDESDFDRLRDDPDFQLVTSLAQHDKLPPQPP